MKDTAKKPILVIMAAGMGSRFGGLKQIEAVGPAGEAILDYSLFDAHRAGFETVVFIIKHAIEDAFKSTVGARAEKAGLNVRYAYQELDILPEGFTVPEGRIKPWGTAHAILVAEEAIGDAPFAVINADDYYGPQGFKLIYDYLSTHADGDRYAWAMVGFLLGTNIGEVITVFAAMLLWRKTPLLSMQLLLINLATDSLPAIALGMEAVEADVMDKKPKPKSEGLFAHGLGVRIVLQGFLFALLTLIGFVAGEKATGTLAGGQTLAFMVLALSQVVQAYNMRSDRSLFAIGPFSNHKLNWAALASTALVALVLFTPVGIAFGLVTLPWQYYLLGLGLILAPLLVMEIAKLCGLIRHHGRK